MHSYSFIVKMVAIAALAGPVVAQPSINETLMINQNQPIPGDYSAGRMDNYINKAKGVESKSTPVSIDPKAQASEPFTSESTEPNILEPTTPESYNPDSVVEEPKKTSKPDRKSKGTYIHKEIYTSKPAPEEPYNPEPTGLEPIPMPYNPELIPQEPENPYHSKSKHHSKKMGRFNKHDKSKKDFQSPVGAYKPRMVKRKPKRQNSGESDYMDESYESEDINKKKNKSKQVKKGKKVFQNPVGAYRPRLVKKNPDNKESIVDKSYNDYSSDTETLTPEPMEPIIKEPIVEPSNPGNNGFNYNK